MLHRCLRLAAVVSAAALLTGCMTLGLYETARTAPPGQFQVGGAITPLNIVVSDDVSGVVFFPVPEMFAKLGVAPGVDIGARWAFGPGLGANVKLQFAKGPLDAAFYLGGSFYGLAVGGAGFATYSLNPRIILSSEPEQGLPFEVNAGVNYGGAIAGAEGETASGGTLSAVGGAGLPFRIGQARTMRIMPELSLSVPVFTTFQAGGEEVGFTTLEGFVASLGVAFAYVGSPD